MDDTLAFAWSDVAIALVVYVAITWVWCRIIWKCTGHKWLGVLWIVPLVNVVMYVWAAFAPLERMPRGDKPT